MPTYQKHRRGRLQPITFHKICSAFRIKAASRRLLASDPLTVRFEYGYQSRLKRFKALTHFKYRERVRNEGFRADSFYLTCLYEDVDGAQEI
ncbi:hypothetical protein SUGI_0953330 [Cryptomeria japonica]|nr:hypothetical protein SUGI_0953330 [Cryptomeria japonica]